MRKATLNAADPNDANEQNRRRALPDPVATDGKQYFEMLVVFWSKNYQHYIMLAWGGVVNFTPQTGDATSKRLLSLQLLWNRQNVHAASAGGQRRQVM